MKTPKEYTENLSYGIITSKMLEDALYSVNKRAKNYRDAAKKSREYTNRFCAYDGNDAKKEEMYKYKEELLKLIKPICIHKEFFGYKKTRVYDYQKNYEEEYFKHSLTGTIIWENCYAKREYYDDFFYDMENVYFFDYVDLDKPIYQYYLYYVLGDHSFHTIIENPDNYDLPVIEVGKIVTSGDNIDDLLSMQFIKKMLNLIHSNSYKYVINTENIEQKFDNDINYGKYNPASWNDIWDLLIDDILAYSKHKEKIQSINFSEEEIDHIPMSLKKKKVKVLDLQTNRKQKIVYKIPHFEVSVGHKDICNAPILLDDDKKYIRNHYSETMSKKEFLNMLLEISTIKDYIDNRLSYKCKMSYLAQTLNNISTKQFESKKTDISKEEVLSVFWQNQLLNVEQNSSTFL